MTRDDESVAAFLAGRDYPCPHCDYNLRDLKTAVCPECGEVLSLRIGLAEPKQGMLIAGLVGLSAVAGFNGLLIVVGLVEKVMYPGGGDEPRMFIGLGIGLVISALAIYLWLRQWRKIRRLSLAARSWLVFACWLLPLVDVVILLVISP
jgi:hypothetical protein